MRYNFPDEFDRLSRYERERTPRRFAFHLIQQVRRRYGVYHVAALWIMEDSEYKTMKGVDCWDISRDARKWPGGMPAIMHPPCGPWSSFRRWCKNQSELDGLIALRFLIDNGGVIEHPHTTRLFPQFMPDCKVEVVDQFNYGHRCRKRTHLLYGTAIPAIPTKFPNRT